MVKTTSLSDIPQKKPFYKELYFHVLIGIVLGVVFGYVKPQFGGMLPTISLDVKFFSDLFIKLLKMLLTGIIFCTVVHGLVGDGKTDQNIGKVGGKAMLYFMTLTTFSLVLGMIVAHVVHPGVGFNVDPNTLTNTRELSEYAKKGSEMDLSLTGMILHLVPKTLFEAFTEGEILQTLFVAVFFGLSLRKIGAPARPLIDLIETGSKAIMVMVKSIMVLAPFAAFGSISFTISKYGLDSLFSMLKLVFTFYLTGFLFVFFCLGAVTRFYCGFSILKLIRYLKQELLIILGTSSSETVLPHLMTKMETLGCAPHIVRVVIPTGYSFNLDGTSIAMTLTLMFIAQALNIHLTWYQELQLLGLCMLTSKGAAGVVGSGMIVMASTLSVMNVIPVAGLTLVIGIDRFMSECRAVVNFIGNAVATVVVARWENALDHRKLHAVLNNPKGNHKPIDPSKLDEWDE
jgi:aerobic C4-dicarboxylate transport protein